MRRLNTLAIATAAVACVVSLLAQAWPDALIAFALGALMLDLRRHYT